MKARLGMSPIAWWNDDLVELSDDVSLEECLRQSRSAGFTGMEMGRRFPNDPDVMLPILFDIGTTNAQLRADPLYLGLRQPPPADEELDALTEEFVQAVQELFPGCCIHTSPDPLGLSQR